MAMDGFKEVRDALTRMSIAHRLRSLRGKLTLSEGEIDEVEKFVNADMLHWSYKAELKRYEEQQARQKEQRNKSKRMRAFSAGNLSNGPATAPRRRSNFSAYMPPTEIEIQKPKPIPEPKCPDPAHRLFRAIALSGIGSINDARQHVKDQIIRGQIASYAEGDYGQPVRLRPEHLKRKGISDPSFPPLTVAIEPGGPIRHVYLLIEDIERFLDTEESGDESPANAALEPDREEETAPAADAPAEGNPKPSFSRSATRAAYIERIETWPANELPPSQQDDVSWGKSAHSASRDFMRSLRKELAPDSWHLKPGGKKTDRTS
ncbi:hypothetical protein [Hwanghaeella sp.]|uniref:hypothetical protein n=1 Tax=Hwanghaeella sp. TaxID=2605943 RepID=UPI003CCBE2FE